MRRSLRLGRVAGIPIDVNWSIVGVAGFVIYTLSFEILPSLYPSTTVAARVIAATLSTLLFFVSILGHELGHAVVARRHGVEVGGITLWLLGGVARLMRQAPSAKAEFEIAAAGPATSFSFGLGFGAAAVGLTRITDWQLSPAVLAWLAGVNVLLAISNLLPAAPLDGGRMLSAYLWRRRNDPESARLTAGRSGLVLGVGLAVAAGIAVFGFGRGSLLWWSTGLMGVFLVTAARHEVEGAAIRRRLAATPVSEVMTAHPSAVPDSMTLDQLRRFAGPSALLVGFPVVRWDAQPIGYVAADLGDHLPPPAQSWTRLSDVMIPEQLVPRAWSSEPVADVVARLGHDGHDLVVVHDPVDHHVVGTVTDDQIAPLFQRPDLWGRLPAPHRGVARPA